MKTKFIISILFLLNAILSFAQVDSVKKKKELIISKWQIGINVNTVEPLSDAGFDYNALSQRIFVNGHKNDKSYSLGLNLAYNINKSCVIRLAGKLTNYKIKETRDEREFSPRGNDYGLDSIDVTQSMYSISPGILWNINYNKLSFYGGFQLCYKHYSPINAYTSSTTIADSNNVAWSRQTFEQSEPGGFSIGAGPVVGFYVFVLKGFSIGAEFSTAYSYYKTGGEITTKKTNILPVYLDGGTYISIQTYQGFKFSSMLATINMSISF